MTRHARWCLIFLLGACSDPITVEQVREPMDPLQVYYLYWGEMAGCTTIFGGSPAQVRWFVTDWFPGQAGVVGQWNERHEITLLREARFDKGVVTHEIVHELLQGDRDHSDGAWSACQEFGLLMGTGD